MIKQYTVEEAYTDNKQVNKYIDGKYVGGTIMSYWQVEGYCDALDSEGYTEACDVSKAEEKLHKAEEALEFAKQMYETAIRNPLMISP